MKQFYRLTTVVALLLFFVGSSWGQSTLPLTRTIWNTTPTGWTDNYQGETYANGSAKLDGSGQYTYVYFNDSPGDVDYTLYGYANGSWDGVFKVQESTNGTDWTDLRVINTSGAISGSSTDFTDSPNSSSRYMRWIYETKTNGNVGIYSVNILAGSSLDPEPSNHPTTFTATANSSSVITTSWTDAAAGDQAPSGYLVMANKTGNFANPVDGTAQADDLDWGDNAAVKNVTHGSGASYVWTSLDAATQYFFKIFPYNGSGDLINYKTDETVPTDDATTQSNFDNDSEIDGPAIGSQPDPTSISSTVDTDEDAIRVFDMTVWDYGTADGVATKITQLTIKAGDNNDADWSNEIQGVKLSTDGGSSFVTIGSPTINANSIIIPVSSGNLDIANGEAETVSLYIYLNNSGLTDNAIFEFKVDKDDHGFLTDASGSAFATTFTNNTVSNQILLDVTFNEIRFTQQPTNVNLGDAISPSVTVALTDENGNVDTDADGTDYTIGLTTTGSFDATATTSIDAVSGVATFNNLVFNAQGSGVTITTTDPDDWGWTNITSDAFAVSDLPNLIISEVADPSDYYRGRFIELYNTGDVEIDFSNTTIYLSRQANGDGWYDLQLTGSIGSNETYLIATYTDFETTYYGFAPEVTNANFNGTGNDAVFIYFDGDHSSGTLLDIYGVIDEDGTGKAWEYTNSKAVRKNTISAPTSTWTASEWNIIPNCNTTSMTPGMYPVSTWNGNAAKSNVWATEGNWDNGLPGEDINVFIPTDLTNYPTISSSTTINDIKMANGATLLGQENLTVSGTATVETSITGYTTDDDGWNFISSPVSGMTIEGSDFEPVADEDDFFAYDEETNYWLDQQDAANNITSFASAIGYLAAYAPANAGTKQYVGTLNANASYSPSLSELNTKWNIVGNPYCSKLDWSSVVLANVSSAKVLSNTTGDYTDVSGDLELGQAVFVYAEGSSSVSIPLAAQTHGSGSKKDAVNYTRLNAHYGNHSLYTRFAANDNASQNYEWQLDSRYLHPLSEIPYFSAITQDEIKVSTYVCEAQAEESFIVPLYFVVQKDQEISFDFEGSMGYEIVLEDQTNGSMTELTEGLSYTFTASTTDASDRFLLHFKSTTAVEDMEALEANIYAYDGKIYISGINQMNNVRAEVLSVDGRTLYTESYHGEAVVNVPGHFVPGCYLVRLSSEKAVLTKKLIIR